VARRPRSAEDRREQIIAAALRVFAQKGFVRATNKDIAREAGITPGLIYYYFEDKEALLKAVIEEKSPLRLFEELSPAAWELPPAQFLRQLLLRALCIVESSELISLIRTVLSESLHESDLSVLPTFFLPRVASTLQRYLEQKKASGELGGINAEQVAQIILSSMMGLVLRRQILRDPTLAGHSQEEIVDMLLNTLLVGILPR
jgi:AcrR family transcriptional regulator